jgi:thiol-disulfide isomerase/thioredoxin
MKSLSFFALLLIAAIGAGATGYWLHYQQRGPATVQLAQTTHRPDFQLPDLTGQLRSNKEWDGKIVVVNFWATWCPPCVAEIPMFVEVQQQYAKQGVQFVGIAIDQFDLVKEFAEKNQINYPILMGVDDGVTVSRNFGNDLGALPFTAIVNQQGEVILKHRGEIEREQLEKVITPLLKAAT